MKGNIFDHLASLYAVLERSLLSRDGMIKRVEPEENDRVLDVGGGTGRLLQEMKEGKKGIEVYLLDGSRGMLKAYSFEGHRIQGGGCRTPLENDSFDLVLCIDALHHFENKRESLEEMIRVLKPDGEIVILEFDPNSPITRFIQFGERLFGEPSFFFQVRSLTEFFQQRGLSVEIDRLNGYQYLLQASDEGGTQITDP